MSMQVLLNGHYILKQRLKEKQYLLSEVRNVITILVANTILVHIYTTVCSLSFLYEFTFLFQPLILVEVPNEYYNLQINIIQAPDGHFFRRLMEGYFISF